MTSLHHQVTKKYGLDNLGLWQRLNSFCNERGRLRFSSLPDSQGYRHNGTLNKQQRGMKLSMF